MAFVSILKNAIMILTMMFSSKKSQNSLGVDIGTKVIRAVELSKVKGGMVLENYGEVNLDVACKEFFRSFDKKNLNPAVNNISAALRAIIAETGIKTRKVVFSLPDFATFFTTFELPPMTKKEIVSAIGFEARKYIPLPLSELVLDWQMMNKESSPKENSRILVMAVPKIIVEQYKTIAEQSGLELIALEAEAVALKRAVAKEGDHSLCLLEIGFQSTNINIIDQGFMKMSFSFDMAGKDLTYSLSETLNISTEDAEVIKKKQGLIVNEKGNIAHILTPILSVISEKTKKVISNFEEKEGKKVEKIIIAGGTSLLPGIVDYFSKSFSKEGLAIKVELASPFVGISYPSILNKKMEEINPTYAIALGEALRKFE
ncbi:MAG: type IV pilus assembly protein PilM [Candidatus Paceibacterota bacterium]|jgi:type IV pilus assembly protein PilM